MAPRSITIKEVKVSGQRDDLVTLPFIHNKWVGEEGDSSPMVPSPTFHGKVMGQLMAEEAWVQDMQQLEGTRAISHSEGTWLIKHHYLQQHSPTAIMLPTSKLADYLEASMAELLPATISSLREVATVQQLLSFNRAHSSTLFPEKLPKCTLGGEHLIGSFSLRSTQGTTFRRQLDKLEAFKFQPPISTHGNVRPVAASTFTMMQQCLEELGGWASKHRGMQPSLDLVMQCHIVAEFMAFKKARGVAPATLILAAAQFSQVVPFVMGGSCPRAKAWGPTHAAMVLQWYSSFKGQLRQQVAAAKASGSTARQSTISLAEQWEYTAQEWADIMHDYEVSEWGVAIGELSTYCKGGCCSWPLIECPHTPTLPATNSQAVAAIISPPLAKRIIMSVQRQLLGGYHQPPIREGAIRVMHQHGQLDGVECISCG